MLAAAGPAYAAHVPDDPTISGQNFAQLLLEAAEEFNPTPPPVPPPPPKPRGRPREWVKPVDVHFRTETEVLEAFDRVCKAVDQPRGKVLTRLMQHIAEQWDPGALNADAA